MVIIQRRSLAVEVATQLQEQILRGDYKVNQQLPIEQKLMDGFGVGRSTIREAIKILVNSGYVRVQQGLGTFIEDNSGIHETMPQRLKRAAVGEVSEVRQLLEMKMAEKAAQNRSGNDISKLEYYFDKRKKAANANQPEEFIDAHIKFYQAIADASKNEILNDLFKSFAIELKNTWMTNYKEGDPLTDPGELHHKMLDSILRQDPTRAWYWSGKITGQITT